MYNNEPCNKKDEPFTDYKLCKDYIHKYFFKCTKGEYLFGTLKFKILSSTTKQL